MATAVEHRSQPHLGSMGYDHMRYAPAATPQFTDPWVGTHGPVYHPQAAQQQQPQPQMQQQPQQQDHRTSPMTGYTPSHPPAQPLGQDMLQHPRPYDNTYVSAPQSQNPYLPTSAPRYSPEQYQPMPYGGYDQDRRPSYQLKAPPAPRDNFGDALDASRGMVAMSQDITPRNIYGPRSGSHDSYGFPAAHSTTSSVSSASGYPYNYGGSYQGSVDGSSVTDYSSASEEMNSRTLPVPGSALGAYPPEPQSMMTQFNSKLSPSAQKKHKCKICDKRFTRPSSLQTHMYSHTGEKPFACDFEGCGRHFSVVSNLRRHKKCHKSNNDTGSVDEE